MFSPTPSVLLASENFEARRRVVQPPALRRLLQALQNFGHFIPFSTLPAAFISFHSAAHFFSRSRVAARAAARDIFAVGFAGGVSFAAAGFISGFAGCACVAGAGTG